MHPIPTMEWYVLIHTLWLPGRPSKQAAVGGSTANNVSKGPHALLEIVQVAVKIWMASASQTQAKF